MMMETRYNPVLVGLSVLVAIFASYVALNLAHSVTTSRGRTRLLWLSGGSIWSMHFVGMLAFEMPGMEMGYDIPLMILSIIVAVGASALALFIVSRHVVPTSSLAAGGVAMAGAIAGMHYIGMYSMRMAATIVWNPYLVVLSIMVALVASWGALLMSFRLRYKSERHFLLFLASLVMGIAISGMHYIGMFAATFVHHETDSIDTESVLVSEGLVIFVLLATAFLLVLSLVLSVGHRMYSARCRRALDRLKTSEERFRALVEAVKDYAIFMLDKNGYITTWNRGAEKITGYTADKAIGQHVTMMYTQEDIDRRAADIEMEAAKEGHFETEGLRVRRDGSTYWANIVVTAIYNADGSITGYSKVARDVTELRAAERRLRALNEELEKRVVERTLDLQRSESQLRMIANALPVFVGKLDVNERFIFVNDALANWFQRSNAQMLKSTFSEVLGEDRYPANEPHIKKALRGEIATYERVSYSGNRRAVLSITFVPEFGPSSEVVGFILLATDITKHKSIEDELKAAKEAAEVASSTKSAFLANMSHEIRTPLGAILGFSELLTSQDLSPSEKLSNVEVIKRNGRLLSNIINDILDLSKVEAGKLEVERINVPFDEILNDVRSLLTLEAAEKGIRLTVATEGVLPQTVNTDPLRLRQILLNILGNAIKFTKRGSVTMTVRMDKLADGTRLVFTVQDTGEGIPTEKAAKLFAPFTQADASTTRKFGGTGLGLVLSKKLAQALGGDVLLLESAPGHGSVFQVTVDPGNCAQAAVVPPRLTIASNVDKVIDLTGLKILVVEDSPDNQFLITRILNLAGAKSETANNGREGVDACKVGDYDVILMDLQMPEMDGYEATKELRQRGFSRPIIALTAHAMKEERQRCLDNGFSDHLTKPLDRMQLLEVLNDLRQRKEAKAFSDSRFQTEI